MTSVALFNSKGGVGKTTLTYHLAHMLQRLGHRVLAVDLDPQSNLTAQFLDEDDLDRLWHEPPSSAWPAMEFDQASLFGTVSDEAPGTIATAVAPIREGLGDIFVPSPIQINDGLWLLAGDLELSGFEDKLSESWPKCFTGDQSALRTTTAFHRIIEKTQTSIEADLVLIDVGPNLGAINRAALLSADTVLTPLAADLFSMRGLHSLGPTLRDWRTTWQNIVLPRVPKSISAPRGTMKPLGYVIMQPIMRLDRPIQDYRRWLDRIPAVYASSVLGEPAAEATKSYEIATLKNYQSLMFLAHDARKPMFDLRSADGAIGSTQTYVQKCYQDFQMLARALLERLDAVQ